MAKFPSPATIAGPGSMRGGGPMAAVDTSGLTRGQQALAQGTSDLSRGFMSLSGSFDEIDTRTRQRQTVADLAKAEALWTKGSIDLGNSFGKDGDWRTMRERADKQSVDLKNQAADLIRDEDAKQRFLADTELRRLTTVDAINDHATGLSQQEDRVNFLTASTDSAALISDPGVGDATRAKAKADIAGGLDMAVQSGLYTPEEAYNLKVKLLDGSEQQLAINRAYVAGQTDPNAVIKQLGFPEPGKTGEVAPEYKSLDAQQRLSLADHMREMAGQQRAELRGGLAITATNAPAAIANTGSYDGTLPTEADFTAAYGPLEGPQRAQAFNSDVEVAQTTYGMRSMSNAEIEAAVQAATPTSSGDDAAVESEAYRTVSTAAQRVLEARERDPAGYVASAFPNVASAWQDVGDDPAKFAAAVTMTAEAQKQLGMEEMELLPASMADAAVKHFKDQALPQEERIDAVIGLVTRVDDPEQQRAIYDQLVKAGVPPHTEQAMNAWERGDQAAAMRLFQASLVDPKALSLPNSEASGVNSSTNINTAIDKAFADGSVADVFYGLSDGSVSAFDRQAQDMPLIMASVKMRLATGSATNPTDAVNQTIADMYGDVQVIRDQNVEILLPTGDDYNAMRGGFRALLGPVGEAVSESLTPLLDGVATNEGQAVVLSEARARRVNDILRDGHFTSKGDGFVFVDPHTGEAVPGSDGYEMVFSKAEVIEAGAAAEAMQDAARPAGYPSTPIVNPAAAFPMLNPVNPLSGASR